MCQTNALLIRLDRVFIWKHSNIFPNIVVEHRIAVEDAEVERQPTFEVPNPENYNMWVFTIQRVARSTRDKIFTLHKQDPLQWFVNRHDVGIYLTLSRNLEKLSDTFGLMQERVRAILALKQMEDEEAQLTGKALDTSCETTFSHPWLV